MSVAFEQLVALLVDHAALVVGDVVVFEQLLADVEVARLDAVLRLGDRAVDDRMLDRLALGHLEPLHDRRPGARRRRCAAADPRATGRSATSRDRPGGRRGRAAGCRCAATRGARCRRCAGRRRRSPRRAAPATRRAACAICALLLGRRERRVLAQLEDLRLDRAAQHDVGAAAGHVGRDGDRLRRARPARRSRPRARAASRSAPRAAASPCRGGRDSSSEFSIDVVPTSTGWPRSWQSLMSATIASTFSWKRAEHLVVLVLAHHRHVRRDHDRLEVVDLLELERLGVRRAGHAGELAVHAEIVLERDRRERLVLALDRHAFLRLDRLVQAVGPAAARTSAGR